MDIKPKERAVSDFVGMIEHSWTWDRMTGDEQSKLLALYYDDPGTKRAIVGSYEQRWMVCNAILRSYLSGIGYTGFTWREKHPSRVPSF